MSNKCDSVRPKQTRKIKPTRRSVSGIYAFRGNTAIAYESTLERDFIIRKEFDLHVQEIIPQPIQVPFVLGNGRTFTYTPDFLVYFHPSTKNNGSYSKPVLIEVKEESEWRKHWREWMPKWKAAYRYAKEQGWGFHIHDESRIRDVILQNIGFLSIYQRMNFAIGETQSMLENVRNMGVATHRCIFLKHALGGMTDLQVKAHIWHLLATRYLDCDMTRPLDDLTELWVTKND